MRGEDGLERQWLHIEHSPRYHCLTDGKEKYVWFINGTEQLFDLVADPNELHDCIRDKACEGRVETWRQRLIKELRDRPEGFTDGKKLIPGRPYHANIAGNGKH